jgi:uncharacterized membrane protein
MEAIPMFELPTIPSWDALHPAISHFPIALLLVAPLFVLVGLWLRDERRTLWSVAIGLMVAGTVGVYLSAATGDAAKELAQKTPEVTAALEKHESIGELARALFSVLTVLLAALHVGPGLIKRALGPRLSTALACAFLAVYAGAALILVNAASSGGLLVHVLGVHARLR